MYQKWGEENGATTKTTERREEKKKRREQTTHRHQKSGVSVEKRKIKRITTESIVLVSTHGLIERQRGKEIEYLVVLFFCCFDERIWSRRCTYASKYTYVCTPRNQQKKYDMLWFFHYALFQRTLSCCYSERFSLWNAFAQKTKYLPVFLAVS